MEVRLHREIGEEIKEKNPRCESWNASNEINPFLAVT
jgi:hypothetical protein